MTQVELLSRADVVNRIDKLMSDASAAMTFILASESVRPEVAVAVSGVMSDLRRTVLLAFRFLEASTESGRNAN